MTEEKFYCFRIKFSKTGELTAIQPVSFLPEGREAVKEYCEEAIFYDTEPQDDREIIERIGDSDAVFVSYNRTIGEKYPVSLPKSGVYRNVLQPVLGGEF